MLRSLIAVKGLVMNIELWSRARTPVGDRGVAAALHARPESG